MSGALCGLDKRLASRAGSLPQLSVQPTACLQINLDPLCFTKFQGVCLFRSIPFMVVIAKSHYQAVANFLLQGF